MLVSAPEFTGGGARQVIFDGRDTNPEITLLVALDDIEELIALADDDVLLIDDAGLLPEPLLPPPQDIKHMKLAISSKLFTQAFIVITSQCNKTSGNTQLLNHALYYQPISY